MATIKDSKSPFLFSNLCIDSIHSVIRNICHDEQEEEEERKKQPANTSDEEVIDEDIAKLLAD